MKPTRNGSVRSGTPPVGHETTSVSPRHSDHTGHTESGAPPGASTIVDAKKTLRTQRHQNNSNCHQPNDRSNGPVVECLNPLDMPRKSRKGAIRSQIRLQSQQDGDFSLTRSSVPDQRQRARPREFSQSYFDPRRGDGERLRKRQAHDIVTSICMFVLMPTALVILLVYLIMLCKYYSCLRNALKLGAIFVETLVWSGPVRLFSNMAGIPVVLGMAVSIYYLIIFYFNSDVPGIHPPLPHVSWQAGVRADPNYSFGLLLGFICLVIYSVPEVLQFHSERIYNVGQESLVGGWGG
ncbi:hypothetical protein BIW11_00167 [Tropilaelaps mercedesae]|uniref:Uncharacterized protein n=1 Tax=Tropilaelaps mercedesae TaxID=418985 RepID=A0A1V9Y0V2_9ACAR|nr:hypothetical protein BIW11_00167 [Tropilaelaps mercedesae]